MIPALLGKFMPDPKTDDEKVILILCEWTAGGWVYFSQDRLLSGKTVPGLVFAILAIAFAIVGVKWPTIKPKISQRLTLAIEQLAHKRLYRQVIYGVLVFTTLLAVGMRLYRWHLSQQIAKEHTAISHRPAEDVSINLIDHLQYIRIPAGTFSMGCSEDDDQCAPEEKPVRQVAIDKFKIGQTEVTVRAYKIYLHAERKDVPKSISALADDEPVGYLTWENARGYCLWSGGRLPSEEEWEYAARGGSPTAIYGDDIRKIAWYHGNSGEEAHPVGKKLPNGYGLYDVLGNVWEWTNDWYLRENDPEGHGNEKVLRGGSYHNDINLVRVSDRNRQLPDTLSRSIGVRCVQDE